MPTRYTPDENIFSTLIGFVDRCRDKIPEKKSRIAGKLDTFKS